MSASSKASLAKDTSVACQLCGITVSRKDDLARHMKLHSDEREKLKICCPWEGCSYKSLQKSNVQTHVRTHTGEKLQCPSCAFATTDGGSLIRHRKRIHGYQPKTRRQAATGKVSTSKISRRLSPYSRENTSTSNTISYSEPLVIGSSPCSPASSSSSCLELLCLSDSVSGPGSPQDIDFTFPWDKTFVGEDSVICNQESSFIQPNSPPLEPLSQFPAAGAVPTLLGTDLSQFWPSPYPFVTQPTQPFESVGSSPKYLDIHPAYEFTAAPTLFPMPTYQNATTGNEMYNFDCGLGLGAPCSLSDYIGSIPTTHPGDSWNALQSPRSASSDVRSLTLSSPSVPSSISSPSPTSSDSVWSEPSPTPSLTSEEYEQFVAACSA